MRTKGTFIITHIKKIFFKKFKPNNQSSEALKKIQYFKYQTLQNFFLT